MGSNPTPDKNDGSAKGAVRDGVNAGLSDVGKDIIKWVAAAIGALLTGLVPQVRTFLTTTEVRSCWVLVTAILCLVAGAILGRYLLGRKHAEKLKVDFAQERSALESRIDALEEENEKLKRERKAIRLNNRVELEGTILDKTKELLSKFPDPGGPEDNQNGKKSKRNLSLAVLAIDNVAELTKDLSAGLRDAFTTKAELFIAEFPRPGDDMFLRLEQRYYLVMPTVPKLANKVLPERILEKTRGYSIWIEAEGDKKLVRNWRLSFGVATLDFPESRTDDVSARIRNMIKLAEERFTRACAAGGDNVCDT